jgi:hypothetical protein
LGILVSNFVCLLDAELYRIGLVIPSFMQK